MIELGDDTPNDFGTVVREVALPLGWRLGAHGDPIAVFDATAILVLELRADGSVTWRDDA